MLIWRRLDVTARLVVAAVLAAAIVLSAVGRPGGATAAEPKQGTSRSKSKPSSGETRTARRHAPEDEQDGDGHPFAQRTPAPALDGGIEWINTAAPIDLKRLRGKFVLLDFWTYCCINCMHILPELKKLEHAYPNELVVIGVHSAKFATEQDSKNIKEAVLRYEIEHPVVNDAQHRIWDAFQVQSWPTLIVIDPEGNIVAGHSGEIDFESLDKFFKSKMPYYRRKGLIDSRPLWFARESYKADDTPLRFPGKLLADEKTDRLYIADSNHNRIVVTRLDGTLVETIGSGEIGAADGDFAKATFNHPQGMALGGGTLYVADTENHLLRKIDLDKKQVHTIAGTGKQGHGWPGMSDFVAGIGKRTTKHRFVGAPLKTAINSPWALWLDGDDLYIAMAGSHQIWKLTQGKTAEIGPFAGNGAEDIVDGPHLPSRPYEKGYSSFAQPSGLSSDGSVLFVADSEGSSVRAVPLDAKKEVETVIGTADLPFARLFTFGDADGQGSSVRLQHALDVLFHDGVIYVADTYNNKIKAIDPAKKTCVSIAGSGKPGAADQPAEFDEPAGLAFAADKLFVADTNNHAIRTIDLAHGNQVATLEIKGLTAPAPPASHDKPSFPGADQVELKAATVRPVEGKVRLVVDLQLPSGYKINQQAPLRYLVESSDKAGPINREALGKLVSVENKSATFDIELPAAGDSGREKLKISLAYYYCQDGSEGVCKAGSVVWSLPLALSANAKDAAARLPYKVQ